MGEPSFSSTRKFHYQGVIRSGNANIYWEGYDPIFNQSAMNLLNLNDKCLMRIIGFLEPSSQCQLYDTCKRTRHLVSEFISNHVFYASPSMDGRIFQSLGKYIRCMHIGIKGFNINSDSEIKSWGIINDFCREIELHINNKTVRVLEDIYRIPMLRWPTVRKLTFSSSFNGSIGYYTLRSFECQSLSHLEIQNFAAFGQSIHEGAYSNLTTFNVCVLPSYKEKLSIDKHFSFHSPISLVVTTSMCMDFSRH